MSQKFIDQLNEHLSVMADLGSLEIDFDFFCQRLKMTLEAGGKILIAGNGGSASDAQHFAAELTGMFELKRRALPAIALTTDTSAMTSIGNDLGFDKIFVRQLEALARPEDLFVGISTSGNSPNIIAALEWCHSHQIESFGLSGKGGGLMNELLCDRNIVVPSQNTARIQEAHIFLIHQICRYADEWAVGLV